MILAERMADLVELVRRAATLRNDADAANSKKADHEIRDHLMAIAAFREVHAAIESILLEDNRFQERQGDLVLHSGYVRFTSDFTIHWLAIRATKVTAEQACADLHRFLSTDDFPYTMRVAVSGVFTDHDVQFGPGLWLRADRNKHLPEPLQPKGFFRSLLHMPMVALIEERVQKITKRPEQDSSESEFLRASLEADDVLLCLSLVALPAVPFLVGLVCQPADWVPFYGYLDYPRSLESSGHQKRLWKNQTQRAQMIYDSFRSLTPRAKDRIRLPMRRLNTAMRRRDDADSAIDLGIALEGLVLGETDSDKKYQLGVRCAFLLGDDPDSRHRVYDLATVLYHLRNRGVHRGVLKPDDLKKTPFKGREVRKVLEEGGKLVAEVIERFMENNAQDPAWDSLVLGQRPGAPPAAPIESPEF
ncbi:MAG TPA: hypothetical protein VK754_09795 [Propionibacteriaceae bacterium]|nr:hypothetical protein [Propionibacteriaceae bacterium]